jgi:metallo-beta-lactamase family protein
MSLFNITFAGGAGTVTGANFLLKTADFSALVDCGLLQGEHGADQINSTSFSYDPKSIQYLFVTHAHMDHIGRIGKLVRDGFSGKIYSTNVTKEISAIMLDDAIKLIDQNARKQGTLPLYEKKDVEKAFSLWEGFEYHDIIPLPGDASVFLKDSGHILGSTMYEFKIGPEKVVFTGDLGNSPTPLLKDTEPVTDATYMVMESVYGDRNHESKSDRDARFEKIVREAIARGGTLVIPAFSLERTQVILYELNKLVESGKVPSVPVFLDSPLAIKVTEIYKRRTRDFNSEVQSEIAGGDDIFKFPKLKFTVDGFDSRGIEKTPGTKIIIAGGGMSQGGRVVNHEKYFLPDPKSTILLVGFQSLGTLGREIQNAGKEVFINGEKIPVRAKIEMIEGYSSHKDSDHLVEFVSTTVPTVKKVFVTMGEPKASLFLAQKLRDNLGVETVVPEAGEMVEI